MTENFTPKAYLKSSCPFCFKLVMFLAEAKLMDKVEIIRIESSDEAALSHYRDLLQKATGKAASFPTVELSPGEFSSDSDGLIDYFGEKYSVELSSLPGLAYYKDNLFPAYLANFRELKALRAEANGAK